METLLASELRRIYSILGNQIILIRLKNTLFVFCASCIAYNRLQYVFLWPLPLPFILKENVWEMFVYLLDSDIWHESLWIQEKWSSCMLNVTWSIYKIQRNAIMWVHLIFHVIRKRFWYSSAAVGGIQYLAMKQFPRLHWVFLTSDICSFVD